MPPPGVARITGPYLDCARCCRRGLRRRRARRSKRQAQARTHGCAARLRALGVGGGRTGWQTDGIDSSHQIGHPPAGDPADAHRLRQHAGADSAPERGSPHRPIDSMCAPSMAVTRILSAMACIPARQSPQGSGLLQRKVQRSLTGLEQERGCHARTSSQSRTWLQPTASASPFTVFDRSPA